MAYDFNEAYEFFTRFPENPVLTVAIDNESTGIHLKHGDMPFMTAATFSNGEQWLWQAEVDPFTRQPLWSDADLEELKALYQHRDWTYVMSNMKFDTRCAALLDPTLDVMDFLCRCHETIGEHHALKNNESHALKDAASKHAKISDDDEQELHDAVRQARKEAALLGWAIASPLTCPQQRRRPKKGWEVMDMWVPRQLALHRWRTSEAGQAWETLPKVKRVPEGWNEKKATAEEKVQIAFGTWPGLVLVPDIAQIKHMQGWEWHPPEVSPQQVHPWHTFCAKYCKQDTLRSYLVHKVFEKALREESLWEIYMEFRINTIISYAIEENGVPFFPKKAQAFRKVLLGEAEYAKEVSGYALSPIYPFNPASPDKVRRVLYNMFGLPVTRLTKSKKRKDGTWSVGQPTTDKDFLATVIGFCTPEDSASLKPPTLIEDDRSGWKKGMMAWHKELIKDKENGKAHQLYIFCSALLQYSKANKNVSQIDAFLSNAVQLDNSDTHWLLPSINPYGTKTTRQSSSNPNGTNISKGGRNKKAVAHLWKNKQTLRTLFGPPQGFEWWSLDYNKIQPMIFAVMSKTDSLLQAMIRGEDPYEFLARIIFGHATNPESPEYSLFDPTNNSEHSGHRDIGKTTLLAFLFGAGPAKIDLTAGMPGLYEILCNRLPSVIKFLEKKEFEVIRRGYVETLGGYRLYVAEDKAYSGSVIAIQGTEGEIVKRAEYGIQHYLHKNDLLKRFYISLPVHDELNFIAEKDFGQQQIGPVSQIMVDAAASFGVPCGVGIKYCPENWGKGIPWEEEVI